jgi:GH15 family glucan-1,4-alpha-glucosidase
LSEPGDDSAEYPPIGDYAVIGDCRTAALVSREGSIDWYCRGRFDAPAAFCRLLDSRRGGYFAITPGEPHSTTRRYVGPTNVLETTFESASGRARVTDFMPLGGRLDRPPAAGRDEPRGIARLVECLAGSVDLMLRFRPTLGYARAETPVDITPRGVIARGSPGLVLDCPGIPLAPTADGALAGQLTLSTGERRWVALGEVESGESAESVSARLASTDWPATLDRARDDWSRWADRCTYRGPYRELVRRSVLVLKLLTYAPTGAVVAAPTTSLPESVGGPRNWDYRYTWLRDSSLILYALMTTGYESEASAFFGWLESVHHARPTASFRVLYRVDGGSGLNERTLDWLSGYRDSRPVRIGNGAAGQVQLDIYGDVLRAAYLHFAGRSGAPIRPTDTTWGLLRWMVEQAAARWSEPDSGIWEVRGGPRQFLYSRLMCWAALDRGVRLAESHGLPAPLAEWRATRDAVRRAILTRGFDARTGSFVQAFGDDALDASALAIPIVGFLPATDPRFQSTVARIRTDLVRGGLVDRYRNSDGLPGSEGTFAMCSLWLVDALALGGRLDEAHSLFERIVGYANDVGLLAEEIDPTTGDLLGNFPQGFTHLAIVGSAVNLAKARRHGVEDRPENEAERAGRAREASGGHEGCTAGAAAPGVSHGHYPGQKETTMAKKFERTLLDLKGEFQWIRQMGWSDDDLRQVPVFEQATTNEDYLNLADWGGTSLGTSGRPDASPASGGVSNLRNMFIYSSQTPRPLYERLRKLIESNPTQSEIDSAFGGQGGSGGMNRPQGGNR